MDRCALRQRFQACESQTLIRIPDQIIFEKLQVIECVRTISVDLTPVNEQSIQQGTPDGVPCSLASMMFPSARGVVEMIARDGSTVMLAATGHIRSFIAQRLNEDGEQSSKANLAPITAKIIAYPTGSAFESDWIVHERARMVDLGLYTKLNEQNRQALLVFDDEARTWRVEDTMSLNVGHREGVIGPILTKQAAKALGETLDDVYELCRYPKELALTPWGTACAYKQMGRCPGVCDGSESLDSYHERFTAAIETASAGVGDWKHQLKGEIKQASAELDFEHAQIAKRQLEQVEKLPMDGIGLARSMSDMSCVCITPCVRKGWAMVWVLGDNGLHPIAAVNEDQCGIETAIQVHQSSIGLGKLQLERFALVARHWMTKPSRAKRRRVTILDIGIEGWQAKITRAIADACLPVDHDHDDEEHTHIKR